MRHDQAKHVGVISWTITVQNSASTYMIKVHFKFHKSNNGTLAIMLLHQP